MTKRRRRHGSAAAVAAAALLITACGSDSEFPPPAEPGVAPEPTAEPVGAVIELPGGEAEGVAVDPKTNLAAVGTRDPDALFLIDEPFSSRPGIRRIEIPESVRHLQLAEPGGPVLGTAERTDTLLEIELPTGDVRTTSVGDFPHDATAAAARIFVADEGGDTISVVEGDAVTATLPAPEQPGGIAAAGDSVGVVAVAERTLATYDAETLVGTGEVGAGVGPTHIVASDDGRFYVADTQGDAILVYETGPEPRLVDRANLPGAPYGIAIDARNERLWVTQTERNRVVELELTDLAPRRLASFPTVRQPNSVAVDPSTGNVFVAGRSEGVLQVFDPSRARSAEDG